MLSELAIRFVLGGLIVSAFAVIGDMLHPKSFAGIFGAAPSVALASLGLTFLTKGVQQRKERFRFPSQFIFHPGRVLVIIPARHELIMLHVAQTSH